MITPMIDPHAWIPLVFPVARKVARTSRGRCETAELVGAGYEGLLKAARSFDPSGAATFKTWAHRKIWFEIIDRIRIDTGWRRKGLVRFVSLDAFDEPPPELAVEHRLELDLLDELERALGCLDERSARVIRARFLEERTHASISAELGVSLSRSCQLEREATEALREAIRDR